MVGKILFCILLGITAVISQDKKVICYYNSRSFYRQGQGQFNISDLTAAIPHCSHLVYGFAGINPETFHLQSLNQHLDIDLKNYENLVNIKNLYPNLKVLLSVGGNEDEENEEQKKKYLDILENSELRRTFIDSSINLIKKYKFDGLDLGWEFPTTKPKKNRGTLSSAFHSLKKKITGKSSQDANAEAHKEQFTNLVRELKNNFKVNDLLVTLSVLPNINSSVYFEPRILAPHLDWINIMAFDFYTPQRNPKEADYPAPLFEAIDRRFDENVDRQIRFWLDNGAPKPKILLGVPTYGRAWKLDSSVTREIPPVAADGSASAGPYSTEQGLLSYAEICHGLQNSDKNKKLLQFADTSLRYGNYAYRLPKDKVEGIWIGYEDPNIVTKKGNYAKSKGLGGISVYDLTLDDFRGSCNGNKFPILKAAKLSL